jgi:hypothetical protein
VLPWPALKLNRGPGAWRAAEAGGAGSGISDVKLNRPLLEEEYDAKLNPAGLDQDENDQDLCGTRTSNSRILDGIRVPSGRTSMQK